MTRPLRANSASAGKFVAAYVGTHGMAHALTTVLDAADRLRGRDDIRFLLVGSGAEQARLRERRDAMQLDNVIMLDQQPRHRMPAIWGLADASIVHLRKTPLFRTVIPSKIFEAMAAGVPTSLGVEGEAAEIVYGCQRRACSSSRKMQARWRTPWCASQKIRNLRRASGTTDGTR